MSRAPATRTTMVPQQYPPQQQYIQYPPQQYMPQQQYIQYPPQQYMPQQQYIQSPTSMSVSQYGASYQAANPRTSPPRAVSNYGTYSNTTSQRPPGQQVVQSPLPPHMVYVQEPPVIVVPIPGPVIYQPPAHVDVHDPGEEDVFVDHTAPLVGPHNAQAYLPQPTYSYQQPPYRVQPTYSYSQQPYQQSGTRVPVATTRTTASPAPIYN